MLWHGDSFTRLKVRIRTLKTGPSTPNLQAAKRGVRFFIRANYHRDSRWYGRHMRAVYLTSAENIELYPTDAEVFATLAAPAPSLKFRATDLKRKKEPGQFAKDR